MLQRGKLALGNEHSGQLSHLGFLARNRRSTLISAPDPLEDHVGVMLAEATRLRKEAMSCLDKPKADPLPQLHRAERLLNEAEILAADAASYVDATQMDTALAELHRQQGEVRAMIAKLRFIADRVQKTK